MTCDQRQPLWLEYAAGTLDAAEAGPLRAHLASGCPQCAAALAEAEAVFHQIPRGLAAKAPPEEAWERLQDRIALHAQLEGPAEVMAPLPRIERPVRRRGGVLGWIVGTAGIAAAAALGILLYQAQEQLHAQQKQMELAAADVRTQTAAAEKRIADLKGEMTGVQQQLADARQKSDALQAAVAAAEKTGADQVASLLRAAQYEGSSDKQPAARGRLYWDKTAGTWTLFAQNMKDPGANKTYELWIVTADGKKLAAGTASPDASGDVIIQAAIPPGSGELAAAALTDEPAGGVAVATGQIQFVAVVGK